MLFLKQRIVIELTRAALRPDRPISQPVKRLQLLQYNLAKSRTNDVTDGLPVTSDNKRSKIKEFSVRFPQFNELSETLKFIMYPDVTSFDKLNLPQFDWLEIEEFEIYEGYSETKVRIVVANRMSRKH
ncbi:hypothetical protein TNCV_1396481 [Trichonephila clavipes]|nr:hypothetical protein TNCV_1396481 [Trichonephila clavipes]